MKTFKSILISLALFAVSFSFVAAANYDTVASGCNGSLVQVTTQAVGANCSNASFVTLPTCPTGSILTSGTVVWNGYSYGGCACSCSGSGTGTIQTASGLSTTSVPTIIGNVIKVILGLSGTVALIFVVVGGVKWMTAKGDATKTGEARKFMISGMIGIIIIAAAYAITDFVLKQITVVV